MPAPSFSADLDTPAIRNAGRDLLSLALMDARNHTLDLLARLERAPPEPLLGALGAIEARARAWTLGAADAGAPPADAAQARERLLAQLEATLGLLESAGEDDASLAPFRAALLHEDLRGEDLVILAQTHALALPLDAPRALAAREPLLLPAMRWSLGLGAQGFAWPLERPAHEVEVPAFEIDAQAVTWAQYIEFVDDGGYDREELWQPGGWAWLQAASLAEGRRGPRHVEQIGVASGAVMSRLFGRPVRLSGQQPVMHVAWWEADAYARWAGRRLPTEVEWEMAAHQAGRRGFRWGDVHEWVAGSLRPWPGQPEAMPLLAGTPIDPAGLWGQARVRRGASFATRQRLKHPRARGFALPQDDAAFVGFRTCAF